MDYTQKGAKNAKPNILETTIFKLEKGKGIFTGFMIPPHSEELENMLSLAAGWTVSVRLGHNVTQVSDTLPAATACPSQANWSQSIRPSSLPSGLPPRGRAAPEHNHEPQPLHLSFGSAFAQQAISNVAQTFGEEKKWEVRTA